MEPHIVTHYVWDAGEWVKKGVYECADEEAVLMKKIEILAANRNEGNRFETQRPKKAMH